MKKFIRNSAYLLSLLFLLCSPVRATDIQVFPTGPIFIIQNLIWGSSGAGGVNNNFFFVPQFNAGQACFYVLNNNPTNGHQFNAFILTNPNPNANSPSDGTWTNITGTQFGNAILVGSTAQTNIVGGPYSGMARVAISLSNSNVQAGNPDTATLIIVQTTGSCQTNIQSLLNTTPSVSLPQSSAVAAVTRAGYSSHQTNGVVNPGANAQLIAVGVSAPTLTFSKNIYYSKLVITNQAAAVSTFNIIINTATGTCNGTNTQNLNIGSGLTAPYTPVATFSQGACTVQPSAGTVFFAVQIPANTTQIVDLSQLGFVLNPVYTGGSPLYLQVTAAAAITGTIDAAILWYEY